MRLRCALPDAENWPKCGCREWSFDAADSWRESLDLDRPKGCTCSEIAACGLCLQVVVDEVDRQQAEKVLWRGIAPDVRIFSKSGTAFGAHWLALGCCGASTFVRLRTSRDTGGNKDSASSSSDGRGCLVNGTPAEEEPPVEIHLTNVEDRTVDAFLDWVYCRAMPENGKVLCDLLELAIKWEVVLLENSIRSLLNKRHLTCRVMLDVVAHCYQWDDSELFDFCTEELIVRKARNELALESGETPAAHTRSSSNAGPTATATDGSVGKIDTALASIATEGSEAHVVLKSLWTAIRFVAEDPTRTPQLTLALRESTVEDFMEIGMCRENAFPYYHEDDFPVLSHSNFGAFFPDRCPKNDSSGAEVAPVCDSRAAVMEDAFWEVCLLETFTYKRSFPSVEIDRYSDVSIVARDGTVFGSYRAILLSASDSFREVRSANQDHFKLSADASTVSALVHWLHSRRIAEQTTLLEMQKLYAAAKEWKLWGLVHTLETRCKERSFLDLLTQDDCIKILGARVRDRKRISSTPSQAPSNATSHKSTSHQSSSSAARAERQPTPRAAGGTSGSSRAGGTTARKGKAGSGLPPPPKTANHIAAVGVSASTPPFAPSDSTVANTNVKKPSTTNVTGDVSLPPEDASDSINMLSSSTTKKSDEAAPIDRTVKFELDVSSYSLTRTIPNLSIETTSSISDPISPLSPNCIETKINESPTTTAAAAAAGNNSPVTSALNSPVESSFRSLSECGNDNTQQLFTGSISPAVESSRSCSVTPPPTEALGSKDVIALSSLITCSTVSTAVDSIVTSSAAIASDATSTSASAHDSASFVARGNSCLPDTIDDTAQSNSDDARVVVMPRQPQLPPSVTMPPSLASQPRFVSMDKLPTSTTTTTTTTATTAATTSKGSTVMMSNTQRPLKPRVVNKSHSLLSGSGSAVPVLSSSSPPFRGNSIIQPISSPKFNNSLLAEISQEAPNDSPASRSSTTTISGSVNPPSAHTTTTPTDIIESPETLSPASSPAITPPRRPNSPPNNNTSNSNLQSSSKLFSHSLSISSSHPTTSPISYADDDNGDNGGRVLSGTVSLASGTPTTLDSSSPSPSPQKLRGPPPTGATVKKKMVSKRSRVEENVHSK